MAEDKNLNDQTNDEPASADTARPVRRRWLRPVLLMLGPVLVAAGAAFVYVNSGRYVETDNAYVKADSVVISAEVAGLIERVAVRENESVTAGATLFEIDAAPYRLKVERGEAQIEAVESYIEGLTASWEQQLERLELARIDVTYYERELERQQGLASRQLGTESDVDEARHDLEVARQQVPIIEKAIARLRAQIGGKIAPGLEALAVPGEHAYFSGNAAYRTVRSMLESARLELARTTVRAPFDGVVSRVPTVGRFVAPGNPVMALVAERQVWIEANFKETQLTHVRPGQAVVMHIDTYPDHEWHGVVETISPSTAAEFSVIPAQNASGNWVKVAQRIPVRIAVDSRPGDPQLRAGMSAIVEIDTRFEREPPDFLSFLGVLRTSAAAAAVATSQQD